MEASYNVTQLATLSKGATTIHDEMLIAGTYRRLRCTLFVLVIAFVPKIILRAINNLSPEIEREYFRILF